MAGIYLHIPFCKQACNYCNFHFSTSIRHKNDFVSALLKEIELQHHFLENECIKTIYFGGGTPSLLTFEDLAGIFLCLRSNFDIDPDPEITLEANPDDISGKKLSQWRNAGINRLSIGVQSFFDEDLHWMNRAHDASQSLSSILAAFEEGFSNISIDLIYGTPTLNDENWNRNTHQALELGVPHLSCYALTVEPKTLLSKLIAEKKSNDIDQSDQARQFQLLMNWLKEAGYEHYEISNFAKPGYRSRHNSSYWEQKSYLGLGPSAHSYNGLFRQWNVSDNARYIQALKNGGLAFETEELTTVQRLNEYIMISLRTSEGCDLSYIEKKFGKMAMTRLAESASTHQERSMLRVEAERIILNDQGKLFADGIASDLFFINL
jgi:oxygen-independent coproporphyrinogen-3 oxidase